MMTFAEELAHVTPPLDDEGYVIQWVDGLSTIRDAIVELLAKFPPRMRVGWDATLPEIPSDEAKLDEIMRFRKAHDVATMIRRSKHDGSIHTVHAFTRDTSNIARVVLQVGGRRNPLFVRRALYDVGIRTLRMFYAGAPGQTSESEWAKARASQREELPHATYTWEHWQERP